MPLTEVDALLAFRVAATRFADIRRAIMKKDIVQWVSWREKEGVLKERSESMHE